MTRTLLLALFVGVLLQSPTTQIVNGTVQMRQVSIMKDGHRTSASLRTARVSIPFSDGKSALAKISMLFEPKSRSFWWTYQRVSPEQKQETDAIVDFIVYISGKKAFGFSYYRPLLWIRESTEHFSTMDEGQAAVLANINNNADQIESGPPLGWARSVNVSMGMGPAFLGLKGSASLFPQPKLRDVARKHAQWHLIFDGPNKDSAEVVLNDDYHVVSTTHFPAKSGAAETGTCGGDQPSKR